MLRYLEKLSTALFLRSTNLVVAHTYKGAPLNFLHIVDIIKMYYRAYRCRRKMVHMPTNQLSRLQPDTQKIMKKNRGNAQTSNPNKQLKVSTLIYR